MTKYSSYENGFTLVELMVVVVIVALLAAIALPSYQEYVRRGAATEAQAQVQQIAMQLDRHKSRNFNYLGFELDSALQFSPKGTTSTNAKYQYTVTDGVDSSLDLSDDRDTADGRSWIIVAESLENRPNFSFMMTSNGTRCKNKDFGELVTTSVEDATCGTEANGGGVW